MAKVGQGSLGTLTGQFWSASRPDEFVVPARRNGDDKRSYAIDTVVLDEAVDLAMLPHGGCVLCIG